MKSFLIIFFLEALSCSPVLSQEAGIFLVLKIKKIENNCYKLSAKKDGKNYTIYSHYDKEEENIGDKIQRNEAVELKIIPFFKTELISIVELRKMGIQVNLEDSMHFVEAALPLNFHSIYIDYYGNKIKIKDKMLYYTSDINGIYKRK